MRQDAAQKGASGWTIGLVVAIILLVVMIGFIAVFSWTSTNKIEESFGSLQKGVNKAGCQLLGPLQGSQCGSIG